MTYQESMQVLKVRKTECEMACATLRQQYENNYLDARKQLGEKLSVTADTLPTKGEAFGLR